MFALDFTSDLPNLIDGSYMFAGVGRLINFRRNEEGNPVRLDKLENGDYMFENTDGINYFTKIDMPSLKTARYMFYPTYYLECHLENWCGNLDSLEDGTEMFHYRGCIPDNFYSNLPKLKNGYDMNPARFKFRGTLQSLENGCSMFHQGSLDSVSVLCIVSSIPDRTGLTNVDGYYDARGYIDIGVGCSDTEEDKQLYAEEGGWNSFQEILDEFEAKNWVVRFLFNGRPTTTYGMRNVEPVQETSIWCKLEEVIIPSDKKLARRTRYAYTSQDGTKFYNIHSYHVSNRENENYIQFNSLEDAIAHWNVFPKENTTTTEE
jgi:hypothetical protein